MTDRRELAITYATMTLARILGHHARNLRPDERKEASEALSVLDPDADTEDLDDE